MDKKNSVFSFLRDNHGLPEVRSEEDVSFLAAGEYNENYLVRAASGDYVFRINHGSQLGLGDAQIFYEYHVLRCLESCPAVPSAYHVFAPSSALGGGALIMAYFTGGVFDYARHTEGAAEVFAAVHACPPPAGGRLPEMPETVPDLLRQQNPVEDIAKESLGLIERFGDKHPLQGVRRKLLAYHGEVSQLGRKAGALFKGEPSVLVNTEVNSGNFIVDEPADGGAVRLVDWEKAVISSRYQDLGHFLVPTTTLWKTGFRFDADGRAAFIRRYLASLAVAQQRQGTFTPVPEFDEAHEKTRILERTILLRALSWCFMAYFEYTHSQRALTNPATFAVIRRYLDEVECFLK